jgi:hypothetical protein
MNRFGAASTVNGIAAEKDRKIADIRLPISQNENTLYSVNDSTVLEKYHESVVKYTILNAITTITHYFLHLNFWDSNCCWHKTLESFI